MITNTMYKQNGYIKLDQVKAGASILLEIIRLNGKLKEYPCLEEYVNNTHHQGVAAEVKTPSYSEVEDIFQVAAEKKEPAFFAILDGVQDPHNLGAILRSADGAGVHGIIIPKDKAVGMTPAVFKASAGAAAHVPVACVTNLVRIIEELKKKGLWIIGTDQEAESDCFQMDYKGPIAIVLGGEGKGMRRLLREKCDFLASIPMYGKVNSLNPIKIFSQ